MTDGGAFSVFDFDDCAYGTPSHDVAIVIFYWLIGFEGDMSREARRLLGPFLQGYERHASLPTGWEEGADRFLAQRESDIYWLLKNEDPEELWEGESRFFTDRRRRILDGVPFTGQVLSEVLA